MARTIQHKRGLEKNLPTLKPGEPAFTTDTKKLFIGSDTGNIDITSNVDTSKLATKTELSTVTTQLEENEKKLNSLHINAQYPITPLTPAKGDGVTNDTTVLNNMIQYLSRNGGGTIYLPKGTYVLKSALIWRTGVSLVGAGVGKTILKTVGVGFSAITYPSDVSETNPLTNCDFTSFEIDGSQMTDSSYNVGTKGMFIVYMRKCVFRDLYIHDTVATGLGVDFLDECVIDNVLTYNCGRLWSAGNVGGAGIGIGTGGMAKEKLIITNCQSYRAGNYGIFIEEQAPGGQDMGIVPPLYKSDGIVISNCIAANGRNDGFTIRGGTNTSLTNCISENNLGNGYNLTHELTNIVLSNNIAKENTLDGITFKGVGNLAGLSINANQLVNNGRDGIRIDMLPPRLSKNLIFTNNYINRNGGIGINLMSCEIVNMEIRGNKISENKHGISVDSRLTSVQGLSIDMNTVNNNNQMGLVFTKAVQYLSLNNNKVFNNGQSKTSPYQDGIKFEANCSYLQMINNWVYDNQTTKTQLRGIVQGGTTVLDYGRIEMNDCRGNGTNGYILGTTNTNTIVANNLQ